MSANFTWNNTLPIGSEDTDPKRRKRGITELRYNIPSKNQEKGIFIICTDEKLSPEEVESDTYQYSVKMEHLVKELSRITKTKIKPGMLKESENLCIMLVPVSRQGVKTISSFLCEHAWIDGSVQREILDDFKSLDEEIARGAKKGRG